LRRGNKALNGLLRDKALIAANPFGRFPRKEIMTKLDRISDNEGSLTVYYDGACPICRFEIAHYQQCKGSERLEFVDVAALDLPPLGAGLDRDTALARFHIRQPDGSLVSGAAAFVKVWQTLPGWRVWGKIAALPPLLALLEALYRAVLPVRSVLSKMLIRILQV